MGHFFLDSLYFFIFLQHLPGASNKIILCIQSLQWKEQTVNFQANILASQNLVGQPQSTFTYYWVRILLFDHVYSWIGKHTLSFRRHWFSEENRKKLKNVTQGFTIEYAKVSFVWTWPKAEPLMWNFIVRQVKINKYLHPSEHPQRVFWYLDLKIFWLSAVKEAIFSFWCQFPSSKIESNLMKYVVISSYSYASWIK